MATAPIPLLRNGGDDDVHVVHEAALAVVRPTTDAATRRKASQFLEGWTRRPEAWDVYVRWLVSYRHDRDRQKQRYQPRGVSPSTPAVVERVGSDSDQVAVQLLCLTMLLSKVRGEVRRDQPETWHPSVTSLHSELWEHLRQPGLDRSLVSSACLCTATVIVRCKLVDDFMAHLRSTTHDGGGSGADGGGGGRSFGPPQETSLRLLACIPSEMEACQDLTTQQVTGELQVHLEVVLDTIQRGLVAGGESTTTRLPACQALMTWAETSHITLSQLNTPTCGGSHSVLPTLIYLLSSSSSLPLNAVAGSSTASPISPADAVILPYDEMTLQLAARALADVVMVMSDHCTPAREAASQAFWRAIPEQRFIIHPLQVASYKEWHDASHALASLLSTFVVEHVDELVAQPADLGLQVLLDIQKHPHTPVALVPLECWLAIDEVPMSERHEHWKRPLYRQLVEVLLGRLAYPQNFTNWEEELYLDSSEFFELRRLVTDTLTSCYFLLRVEMIQMLVHQVRTATHWTVSESALYGLITISKDVCGRCKSIATQGTIVGRDRQETCQELVQLLDQLIGVNIATTQSQHPLLLATVVNFSGAYSPAWHSMNCPPHAVLQLLAYLQSSFAALPMEAAKATRAIYLSCLAKSLPIFEDFQAACASPTYVGEPGSASRLVIPSALKSLRDSMEAVLLTTEEEAMTTVAEGATRLVAMLMNPEVAREALKIDLIQPVINRVGTVMQRLPERTDNAMASWTSPEAQSAIDVLARCLSVIQVIARFCDSPHMPAMGEWLLLEVGPCLEMIRSRTASTPAQPLLLPKWILIHQHILRNALPDESNTIALFTNTLPSVVQALEQSQDPCTLKYISTAVEMFGGKTPEMDQSFQDLLSHVTIVVTSVGNLFDATDLLQAYFECLQRFVLYSPRALCYNPQFATIVSLSVDSISALNGKDAARAALLLLSQLFGWNVLRLSPQTRQIMQEAWNTVVQEAFLRHGPVLTQVCVTGLAGGSQMLWPAYSDCLFAIVQAVVFNQQQVEHQGMVHTTAYDPCSSLLRESDVRGWLHTTMIVHLNADENSNNGVRSLLTEATVNEVIAILLNLARQGPNSRAKAKMLLTDFAKIRNGEMGTDALLSYALQ